MKNINQKFNIDRFLKLFTKELKERVPVIFKYATIFSLILIGIWLTSILINSSARVPMEVRIVYISLTAFITMVMAPFTLYKDFNHTKKGMDYISLPASIPEKYISMILISLVIMPVMIISFVLLTDSAITLFSPKYFDGFLLNENVISKYSSGFFTDIFILPSMFLFGNLLFRRNKVVKTILSSVGIYIILTIAISFVILYVFKDQISAITEAVESGTKLSIDLRNMNDLYNNELLAEYPGLRFTVGVFSFIYSFGLPVGSLAGSYYRMKTMQY